MEPELKLRKKPVRKAATTTKTTKGAPTAKTARSRKQELKPEVEHEDEESDELQGDESAVAPKVIRKGRPKKDDASNTSKPAAAPRARAATTATISKAAATRTTKKGRVETMNLAVHPPTQAKAAPATRATASTRATAAKHKVPPLSPKKITQMPKAPNNNTKSAAVKNANAKGVGQATATGRPVTRRRGVSDENAGIPELRPSTAERKVEEVKPKQDTKSKPATSNSTAKPAPEPETMEIDEEVFMSTRLQTLADSPQLEHDSPEEEEADPDLGADLEVSADELCGPKTPMKRISSREQAQYVSAGKPTHGEDVPTKTPARRFLVLGSQAATPQTQKPYCKSSLPMSEVRPTTVARARDRAMVFRKLQPLTLTREVEEVDQIAADETNRMSEEIETSAMETEQLDISAKVVTEHEDDDVTPAQFIGPAIEDDDNVSSDEEKDSALDIESHYLPRSDTDQRDVVEILFQMGKLSASHLDGEEQDELKATEEMTPNNIIPTEDQDMGEGSQGDVSLEPDDSVIIRHDMATDAAHLLSGNDSMEDLNQPTTTPKPETIIWENLREDITIPFSFDSGLPSKVLNGPQGLSCAGNAEAQSDTGVDVVKELARFDVEMSTDIDTDLTLEDPEYQRQSFGRLSLDATVNLSEFFDISSLAEQKSFSPDNMKDNNVAVEENPAEVDDMTEATTSQHPAMIIEMRSMHRVPTLSSVQQGDSEDMPERSTPHYAMPTIAFRRKSLPALTYHTPMKNDARPKTSEGASMPRITNPFDVLSTAWDEHQQASTPFRRHLSIAQVGGLSRPRTPSIGTSAGASSRKTPRMSGKTIVVSSSHTSNKPSVRPTPKERLPGLPSRETDVELVNTPTAKTLLQFMPSAVKSSMKERFPALPPAENYEVLSESPASVAALSKRSATPQASQPSTPLVETNTLFSQQEERYPGLPHRRTYEEHARTAMPPSRFRTPSQSPAKRPATVQRPASLRKVALRAATPKRYRTPVKTPLRPAAMTPSQAPLTPHPDAPLRGVNAYVDVFLNDGSSANSTYIAVLHSLGAKTTKTFTDRVTHVVFKEGSPATLQRLRLHNKQVRDSANGILISCVNGRWVNDSNTEGMRMDENDEAYAVDIEDQRATKRRRKSMEPTSLLNIGGNVVRDTNRKNSLGRSSLGRALKAGSPSVESPSMMMSVDVAEKENSGDISFGDESPATPAYLAAPDSLVQQTAPMNRVRKLDFDTQEQMKNRRLTFWDGGEF